MVTARILGSVGRFLITSGIVVLLFVAYQLWGTGIYEAPFQIPACVADGSNCENSDIACSTTGFIPAT